MLSTTKILAVTRDTALVNFLQQKLNNEGYEVINTRHTGIQLKHVLEAEKPDFIVLDIVMPTLDGIGECLQLRQWTQLPIMMLSMWGTNGNTVRGLNLCSDSYLTDPIEVDELKKRIGNTLKRMPVASIQTFSGIFTSKN